MISEKQSIDQLVMNFYSDDHLRINKNILSIYGIDIALWIADLSSRWNSFRKTNKLDKNGFFFMRQTEIRESSGLNFNKQTEIIKKLSEDNIIEVVRKGLPKKNYYKINILQLIKLINESKMKAQVLCNRKHKELVIESTRALQLKEHNNNKTTNNKTTNNIYSKEYKDCKKSNLTCNSDEIIFDKKNLTKKVKTFTEIEDHPEEVQTLFNFWQDLKIVNHKKSKTRDNALQNLNIKLQKYSLQEIKSAMQTYKDLLDNPYNILKLKSPYKVGLNEFFKFGSYTKDTIVKSYEKLSGVKSWFDECMKGEDYLEKYDCTKKDEYPNVTKKLKKEYSRVISHLPESLSALEENSFRKAASLLVEFIKKNKRKLNVPLSDKRNPVMFVQYVFEFFERKKIDDANPGWLCSDFFYTSFEAWLKKQGYL